MKPRHQVSRAAIDLIKRFEGYRRKAAQLPDGRWTIGYGHTLTAREGAEVSESDAEALLLYDLIAIAHVVNENTYTPLTQNQFDALCGFAFNIGAENFRRSSALRRINEGAMLQAACAMEMWRKADFEGERIVIDALVRRRAAEKTLFLTPVNGWVPAPSPILRPKVDYDAVSAIPREVPAAVSASLDGDKAVAERDDTEAVAPFPQPIAPSASELAAAAVGARLEQILPDAQPETLAETPVAPVEAAPETAPFPLAVVEDLPEPEVQPEPEAAPEPEPAEPAFSLTPAPEAEAVTAPEPVEEAPAVQTGPTLFESAIANRPEAIVRAQPAIDEAQLRRLVLQDEAGIVDSYEPAFPEGDAMPRSGGLLLMGLALLGLSLFAAGLFWTVYAEGGDGLLTPLTVGWALVIAGVGCMGMAIFSFLKRLGASDDDED